MQRVLKRSLVPCPAYSAGTAWQLYPFVAISPRRGAPLRRNTLRHGLDLEVVKNRLLGLVFAIFGCQKIRKPPKNIRKCCLTLILQRNFTIPRYNYL